MTLGNGWLKRPCVTIASLLLAAQLLPVGSARGGKFYSSRQRARTKYCLPNHDYEPEPLTVPRSFGATAIAVAATGPTGQQERKSFHFRRLSLPVDHLTLDQVGLALYRTGELMATGRITHDGGDGGLIGSNVTIRVRAYVAATSAALPAGPVFSPTSAAELLPAPEPEDNSPPAVPDAAVVIVPPVVERIPPDAYVVWRSEHKLWVSRGRPHYISLVPENDFPDKKLINYFGEITHLEVELEYQRDR